MKKKAVFIDRDGTLIENKGYICSINEVKFYDFAIKALKIIRSKNYLTIVITNQSSIARGICSEEEVINIHKKMNERLRLENTGIDKFYYCPYHEEGTIKKYKKKSNLRKPSPGMLLKAADDLDIDLNLSYMIGDSIVDVIAGNRVGCKTVLVKTGYGVHTLNEFKGTQIKIDLISENLLSAINEIFRKQK